MKVILKSILAETDLDASPKSFFSDIHSRVCLSLGLNESWYFGICYKPKKSAELVWLDTSKKVKRIYIFHIKHSNFVGNSELVLKRRNKFQKNSLITSTIL